MRPSSWTTPLSLFSGRSNAAMILLACATSSALGEKAALQGLDLVRMDQGLAVEAHVAGLAAFTREALRVAEVVVDAVQDIDAVGVRRRHAGHQPRQHRPAARARCSRAYPWRDHWCPSRMRRAGFPNRAACGRERQHIEQRDRRLDHRPDAGRAVGAACRAGAGRSTRAAAGSRSSAPGSRRARRVAAASDRRLPGRVEAVDADDDFARAEPAGATASMTCSRAAALASGATESSRSRMTASAGRVRAFSIARAFEPGM